MTKQKVSWVIVIVPTRTAHEKLLTHWQFDLLENGYDHNLSQYLT